MPRMLFLHMFVPSYPRQFLALNSNVSCARYFGAKRTGSVLAAADLNEVLDVGDFARHFGGID